MDTKDIVIGETYIISIDQGGYQNGVAWSKPYPRQEILDLWPNFSCANGERVKIISADSGRIGTFYYVFERFPDEADKRFSYFNRFKPIEESETKKTTVKCVCDFDTVIMTVGCQCGGE